jgi:adenylate cyclase
MTDEAHIRARGGTALFPRPVLLAGVVAVLAALLLADLMPRYAPGLLRFEHALADVRTSFLSDQLPSQHPHVAIVGITDQTLSDYKTRLPIDRALLARLIDAIDAAGAKVVGIDFLFYRTAPVDNEDMLFAAIRRARAKIILAAADERLGLSQPQIDRQLAFFAQAGRPAGYVNLATERDWVVRFKAQPAPATAYPKSFAQLLAEAAGFRVGGTLRRIAWLREPRDGSDTFLTIPAETLLGATDDPLFKAASSGLEGKIVILGGLFPDLDQHLTPMTSRTHDRMPGAVVHGHIVAEMVDGRGIGQVEVDSLVLRLGLAVLAGFGFLIGWRYRLKRQGILLGSLATVVILAIDIIVFWQFRIILPIVLALLAWFIGEFLGHHVGRWLGRRSRAASMWFAK